MDSERKAINVVVVRSLTQRYQLSPNVYNDADGRTPAANEIALDEFDLPVSAALEFAEDDVHISDVWVIVMFDDGTSEVFIRNESNEGEPSAVRTHQEGE